jgi:HAD superfamily hydrolase (TIGR01509 family)
VNLTEELFKQISLAEGQSVFSLAAERGVSPEEIDRLHEARNRRYTELLEGGVQIMEGVEEALRLLQGRVTQGIVTSSRRGHFETMHRSTGLLPHFDFILTREDFTHTKPDPEPYLRALKHCGLPSGECVVVEDSPRGLAAAVAAGIRCLVVPNDLTRGSSFAGAWRILESCREVPEEICRLNNCQRIE